MSLSVLVVDDDFRVANLHASLVDSLDGFAVTAQANSIEQADALLATTSFDLALVDVYLPDGSGIDLVRRLHCDAIVLSAAADSASIRSAVTAGAYTYLIKPFPRSALVDRLQAYARYRGAVDRPDDISQPELDAALEALRAVAKPDVAASHTVTRDLVLTAVRGADSPMSAGEVATAIGISRATAQRYLAALVSKQRLRMQLRYGSTGRPEQEYTAG
ncbi:transcriptional regulatory protein [Rhodococcoides trifolii]|uniref:Transcriptional regulatory protein n=1 Tax=Rhodococcoides trifolii TaxID=908250 RepID=A0A917D0H4_9NOCA|nr:response regulator [Rhodococcus trifolii]GGG04639.1 transcriptional regulatory protein [Rhodococcus trifolii]